MIVVKPLLAVIVCSTLAFAQQSSSPAQPPEPHGKILFSRSADDAKQTAPAQEKSQTATVKVTDAERAAVVFTAYDLNVHLMLKQQALAVQAHITVRNDGDLPLAHLPMQLSSSLHFETIAAGGKLPFSQQIINSDADHTGQLYEAVIELPKPLAPKAELTLDIGYSGEITASAKRLEQINTPADIARQSDWDQISEDFTGLRGFGDLIWYPVSSVPCLLGDGAKLFSEIGRQKLRQQDAHVSVRVTAEFEGNAPNVAAINGHFVSLPAPQVKPSDSFPGVVTFALPEQRLGFGTLSLFLATRSTHESNGLHVLSTADDEPAVQGYQTAATMALPLVEQWLGSAKSSLTILGLPDNNDAPFEQDSFTAMGLRVADPQKLAGSIAHGLAHAHFQSRREWLNEGVANFLGTLWVEQNKGREAALEYMEASRGALDLAEPASPGESAGQPLLNASDAIYYRGKATYVLWMLRDVAGDKALSTALRSYDQEQDTSPEYFEHLVAQASGKNLKWFFDDWVYHDKGLPDLSISAVYPSSTSQSGQYLLAIDLANDGYAGAEVPVIVRTRSGVQSERVLIPARSKVTRRVLVQGLPTEVDVNDGVVPEVQASVHKKEITITGSGN